MMKRVDVFIPYWGSFSLLKAAVDSVLRQTSTEWRLFILDDHYSSTEALEYFTNLKDSRITYIRHKVNKGITANFNYAVTNASSEYCIIMGCDDVLLPQYIETALKNIGDADFYQPNVEVIDENGKVYSPIADTVKRLLRPRRMGVYSGEKLATSLCHGNWLYFPSLMWKTGSIQKYTFNETYKIVEDVALELSIIKDGGVLFVDSIKTFQYRRFGDSLSSKEASKQGVRFHEEKLVYTHFAKEFNKIGWKRAELACKLRITSRLHQLLK